MSDERLWSHSSVVALMRDAQAGETPVEVVRRKARELTARHSSLWKGPPFCPFELADLEGIRVEEAKCEIKSHGRIFPKGKNVYIEYASGQSEVRKRFTIFHEIAHTLFPDCFHRIRNRSKTEREEWEFESLCNEAASEFLFPIISIEADMMGTLPNAQMIDYLARRYYASIDATSRRIVSIIQSPACAVFAKFRAPSGNGKTLLVTQYAVPNKSFPHKIYPNLRINSISAITAAYKEKVPKSGISENWRIGQKWGKFRVEAVPLPDLNLKETADVAAILYC